VEAEKVLVGGFVGVDGTEAEAEDGAGGEL